MGTRNLTAVMSDGEYRLAQYGQWDGYPEGQGATALAFCQEHLTTPEGRETFKQKLGLVRFAAEGEVARLYAEVGATGEWVNMEQLAEFDRRWPYFSRDHGAKILAKVILATGEVLTTNEIAFAADSLFCEYAYVIDLDRLTLEAFKGFNEEPVPEGERFASMPQEKADGKYYPVRNIGTFSLDNLPEKTVFLEMLAPKDEADE